MTILYKISQKQTHNMFRYDQCNKKNNGTDINIQQLKKEDIKICRNKLYKYTNMKKWL